MREKLTPYDIKKLTSHNIDKVVCVRLIVAMIQADGILMPDEIDYLQKLVDELNLSVQEQAKVQEDLRSPSDWETLISEITIPQDMEARKILLDQVWQVALSDGVLDPKEEELYHKLESHFGISHTKTVGDSESGSSLKDEIAEAFAKAKAVFRSDSSDSKEDFKLRKAIHELVACIKGAVAMVFMVNDPVNLYMDSIKEISEFSNELKSKKLFAYGDADVWAHEELQKACEDFLKVAQSKAESDTSPSPAGLTEKETNVEPPQTNLSSSFKLISYCQIIQGTANSSPRLEITEADYPFLSDWLENLNLPLEKLAVLSSDGDSMLPTMGNGDSVLVYLEHIYRSDGIYLIQLADMLCVKRLQRLPDGGFHIISDNPHYQSQTLHPDDKHQVEQFFGHSFPFYSIHAIKNI